MLGANKAQKPRLATLYHEFPLRVPAQHPAHGHHGSQPEYLQADGPVHGRSRQVAAVDAQGYVLHGGEGKELQHLPDSRGEEGQGDVASCEKVHEGGAHPPEPVGGDHVEAGYVD